MLFCIPGIVEHLRFTITKSIHESNITISGTRSLPLLIKTKNMWLGNFEESFHIPNNVELPNDAKLIEYHGYWSLKFTKKALCMTRSASHSIPANQRELV